MKKTLLFFAWMLCAGMASAEDLAAQQHIRRPVRPPAKVRPPAPFEGGIPRAIQSGNPLHMINPAAPASYGSGAQLVSEETPEGGQHPLRHGKGIKLFSIQF